MLMVQDITEHDQDGNDAHHRPRDPGDQPSDLLVCERVDRPGTPANIVHVIKQCVVHGNIRARENLQNHYPSQDQDACEVVYVRVALCATRRDH